MINIKKTLDYLTTIAFLGVCLVFSWRMLHTQAPAPSRTARAVPLPTEPLSLDPTSLQGQTGATFGILIFSDFQCPYCGELARKTLQDIKREFVDSGKALVAFMHLPLDSIHPYAVVAAEAAACAGQQGKFWAMHDEIFRDQSSLDETSLMKKANAAHLDLPAFNGCMSAHATTTQVRKHQMLARSLRVQSTPTIMVGPLQPDGRMKVSRVLTGAQTTDTLRAVLNQFGS